MFAYFDDEFSVVCVLATGPIEYITIVNNPFAVFQESFRGRVGLLFYLLLDRGQILRLEHDVIIIGN